ncbi:hypothetical protein Ciccas_003194 [Cichlidogyrus casuarinus]|uniref:Uncharacterized protein n=1 Tax=Cichlidogyrus casuarinus TaxID=1844966 RepID=A0ABD2QF22_9PLAT
MFKQRKSLEAAWLRAKEEKMEKDLAARRAEMNPPANQMLPLHDQCSIERCTQCQRSLDNVGTSALLRDTFYTSGARYIC